MDRIPRAERRRIMQQIHGKDTGLEEEFRKKLWKLGIRYRKNPSGFKGNPDLVIRKWKTVIFIDSCFWHGCPEHLRMPKSNRDYWVPKIEKNRRRDLEINKYYEKMGWRIIRIWEHQKDDLVHIAKIIKR